jgi:hypothetical protein
LKVQKGHTQLTIEGKPLPKTDAGISTEQAEAHAEAAREFMMVELVTKTDLSLAPEHQTLRLTVGVGGVVAVAVAVLATIIKL